MGLVRRRTDVAVVTAPAGHPLLPVAQPRLTGALTTVGAVVLVAGNVVGSSVYTLAASLAEVAGPLALVAWPLAALGFLFVAQVFGSLGTRIPRTGGPYAFARDAFGDLAGFQTLWGYWLSAVIGNAAIVTSLVAYATAFVPALEQHAVYRLGLALAVLWGLCLLNVRGLAPTARVHTVLTILNAAALLLLAGALWKFDAANLQPFAPRGVGALPAAVGLLVFAYAGVESATVPAEEIAAPERTVRRATLLGYAVATGLFLLVAVAVVGTLPTHVIAASPRPLALVAERTYGSWAGNVLGAAGVIGGLALLNGWTLLMGRMPVSAARDGVCFGGLARVHPRFGTPNVAIVAGTAGASTLLPLYFTQSLLGAFTTLVVVSNVLVLVAYLSCAAAEVRLARRDRAAYPGQRPVRAQAVAIGAFAFLAWALYGAGGTAAASGALAMLAGAPLYLWSRHQARGSVTPSAPRDVRTVPPRVDDSDPSS